MAQRPMPHLDVPIGLIEYTRGGSSIIHWYKDGVLYTSMVKPVQPYAIKGVIWYQGERNTIQTLEYYYYQQYFSDLIDQWRQDWGQGDFPFLYVQLPRFSGANREPGWMVVRDAQLKTLDKINTAMAITIDIDDTGLHPQIKKPVGERLVLAARAAAYNETIVSSGPVFDPNLSYIQDANVVIGFDHVAGGLTANGRLDGFEIAGSDRIFYPANAQIIGDTVILSNPLVAAPKAARYCWDKNPIASLFNSQGLPACPFYYADYQIDFFNYSILLDHYDDTGCPYPDWCGGSDIDGSGDVTVEDLSILVDLWLFPPESIGMY